MTDLATLSIVVTTDASDSTAKLQALSGTADETAASLAGVEVAAASAGGGVAKVIPATAQASAGFAGLGTATGQAQDYLMGFGAEAATTQATIESMTASMGLADAATAKFTESAGLGAEAMTALAASASQLVPALGEVATATAAVSRESIVLPLHIAHLSESVTSGTVSMRTLGSVARGFSEQIGALAARLGIGTTAFVGIAVAQGLFDVAIIKSIKESQDLDSAITGMAKGVAAGTGLTTEAFEKEIEAAQKMGGVTKSSAEEIGKAYVQTGNVSTEGLGKLISATLEFAKETGTTVPAAMATFTSALASPTAGIAKINDQIKFLTLDQRLEIEALEAQGKASEASAKAGQLLIDKFAQQHKEAQGLSGVWTSLVNGYDAVTVGLGKYAVATISATSALAGYIASTKIGGAANSAFTATANALGRAFSYIGTESIAQLKSSEAYFRALQKGATLAEADVAATKALTEAHKEEAKATEVDTSFLDNFVKAQDTAGKALADATAAMKNWNDAQDAGLVKTQAQRDAMQAAAVTFQTAQAAIMGTNKALTDLAATQDAEAKASEAAGAALQKEAAAARDAAAASDGVTKSASGSQAATDAAKAAFFNATDALAAEEAGLDKNTTALNTNASAANSDASAQSGLASSAASSSGNVTNAGSGDIPAQTVTFHLDDPTLATIKSLQDSISKLGGISAPGAAPTAPAPPAASAGATVASQPGAFGGDKNASFFSDPATRQTFMAQFGIEGDTATKAADRAYQTQYQLQLQQYNSQVAAYASAQQQLKVEQQQLAALLALRPPGLTGLLGTYGKQLGAASGGDWVVNGMPGQDQNLVSLALSHGELISVTPPGQSLPQGGGAGQTITNHITITTPDIASFKQSRASVVAHVASMMAAATKNRTTAAR